VRCVCLEFGSAESEPRRRGSKRIGVLLVVWHVRACFTLLGVSESASQAREDGGCLPPWTCRFGRRWETTRRLQCVSLVSLRGCARSLPKPGVAATSCMLRVEPRSAQKIDTQPLLDCVSPGLFVSVSIDASRRLPR